MQRIWKRATSGAGADVRGVGVKLFNFEIHAGLRETRVGFSQNHAGDRVGILFRTDDDDPAMIFIEFHQKLSLEVRQRGGS